MQALRIVLACLVTVVWLTGYVLAYSAGTSNPTELSGLMALVIGWATAGEVRDTLRKKVGASTREGKDD